MKINTMNHQLWLAAFMRLVILTSPAGLSADSWLGIANSGSDPLRFASMAITVGTDYREVLLRSLPARSTRIWIRIPGDKPIDVNRIVALGPHGLVWPSEDPSGRPVEGLKPGIYQVDINEMYELVVSPGSLADAVLIVPLWGVNIVLLCDRLKLLDHPDVEKENKMIDRLIEAYKPTIIPHQYTSSPAKMSLFSIGYERGWFSRAIPELEFERVDYLMIEPNLSWISNGDEILSDADIRAIFSEAFKAGWDDTKEVMPGE